MSINLFAKSLVLMLVSGFQASGQVKYVRRTHGRPKDDRQKRGRPRSLRRNGIHILEAPLVERRVLWIDLPSQGLITQTNGSSLAMRPLRFGLTPARRTG